MELLKFYKEQFYNQVFPFWSKAFDYKYGGIFTCFNNDGTQLIDESKYSWSQGRYLWILGKIEELRKKGILEVNQNLIKQQAELTIKFLKDNVLLEDGSCCFLLSRSGEKKEVIPGEGFNRSILADCFVLLGFSKFGAEYDSLQDLSNWIWSLFQNVENRIITHEYKLDPYPTPEGMKEHSIPMIMINVTQELINYYDIYGDQDKVNYLHERERKYVKTVLSEFVDKNYRIREVLYADNSQDDITSVGRHINPGHSLEDAWFIAHSALKTNDLKTLDIVKKITLVALELGWDNEQSGIFRYTDLENSNEPLGEHTEGAFSDLINETWSYKLWWPHAEALYATLLLNSIYPREQFDDWYLKIHKYTFSTFPNRNSEIGEWVQIRKRDGVPEDKVVALPVKDPYHIMRTMLLIIDLLSQHPESTIKF